MSGERVGRRALDVKVDQVNAKGATVGDGDGREGSEPDVGDGVCPCHRETTSRRGELVDLSFGGLERNRGDPEP